MSTPRNHIELRDTRPDSPMHIARTVFIDGHEVVVEADSINITLTPDGPTRVTLTILPHRVTFD